MRPLINSKRLPESVLLVGKSFQTKLKLLNNDLVDLNEKLSGRSRCNRRPNEAVDELLSIERRLLETPLTVQDNDQFARRIDLILGISPKPSINEWEQEGQRLLHSEPRKTEALPDTRPHPQLKLTMSQSSSFQLPPASSLSCSSHLHVAVHPTNLSQPPALASPVIPPLLASPVIPPPPPLRTVVVLYAGAQFPGTLLREDGAYVEVLFPDGVQARLLRSQLLDA